MFFTYQNNLPPDVGFAPYSAVHIGTLVSFIILCLIGAKRFAAKSASVQQRITRMLGFAILLLEVTRMVVYHFMGGMGIHALPLHLCGMAVFLCFGHSLRTADWLGQVLYTLCLPGAGAALLFPDWTVYPFFSFVSLHSFLAHELIVFYIVLQVAAGRIAPRLGAIWKPILFLCVSVPPVAWFNQQFHTNYMFLDLPSRASPLAVIAALTAGSRVHYLAAFILLVLAVMICMDLPFSRKQR